MREGEAAYRSGTRKNRTGLGIILMVIGVLFLNVLGNLFIDSVGIYTYIFLPLPILGILSIFIERKRYNPAHRSRSSFSLILIIIFFLLYLAAGLMYKYFLLTKGDLRWALEVIYISEGVWILAYASCIISFVDLENRYRKRLAISAITISTILVIASMLLIQAPATEMMDDIDSILDKDAKTDREKKIANMEYDESVETFREDSFYPRLAQVFAGMITMIVVIALGLKPLSEVKDNIKMRFRRVLTERRP